MYKLPKPKAPKPYKKKLTFYSLIVGILFAAIPALIIGLACALIFQSIYVGIGVWTIVFCLGIDVMFFGWIK